MATSGKVNEYDVVIVGGGPAGISAALWCADLGMSAVVIEARADLGGQLRIIHTPILNYPGVDAADGEDLYGRFAASMDKFEIDVITDSEAASIDAEECTVTLATGDVIRGEALIIATGVRRHRLGISGEDEFEGRGILTSGAGERESARGKRVVIIGGGDAAFENALILREFADSVTVVHRREKFSARQEFVEPVLADAGINVITEYVPISINGTERVESVTVESVKTGEQMQLDADLVLIRIGVVPNSELLAGQVDMDDAGYILVDSESRTSSAGVWAAGDVANPVAPTVATAVGMGATAAKSALRLINSLKKL